MPLSSFLTHLLYIIDSIYCSLAHHHRISFVNFLSHIVAQRIICRLRLQRGFAVVVAKKCYRVRVRVIDNDGGRNRVSDDDGNDDGVENHCGVGGGA